MRRTVLEGGIWFVDLGPYIHDILVDDLLDDLLVIRFVVEISQDKEKQLLISLLLPKQTHVHLKNGPQQA